MTKNDQKNVLIVFLAFITFFSIIKMDIMVCYNVLSFIVFILLLLLYKNYLFKNGKYKITSIVLASIFSVLTIFGRNFYAFYNSYNVNIWREIFSFRSMIYIIGLVPLYFCIIHIIIQKLCIITINTTYKYNNKLFIIISMLLMLGVWSIYLLTYFPGTLSPDSLGEYEMFVNGFKITSDHHPVLHILFMALFYKIGYGIFGTPNMGVLFVSIAQMIILSSIFTYTLVFLRKRNCPKIVSYVLLLFYAFASMNGYYSITMWKDVLFGGFLLLLSTECYKIYENKDNLKISNMISFAIVSLFTVFFRNNAIYAYFILAVTMLILLKKDFKKLAITFLSVISIFLFVKGPVFSWCGIQKTSSSEYIGIPLQQVARVITKNESLTKKEYEKIEKMIPIAVIPSAYNPMVSDGIKFNKNFNINVFNDDKIGYAKLYTKILLKHFPTTLEAYFISTLGYWYPNVFYWSVNSATWENDLNITNDMKTSARIQDILSKGEARDLPLFCMQWSIGLCVWTILILLVCYIKKNKKLGIIPFLPCVTVWITMLIASPVWGEFRYVYGLFTTLPFLIGIFFVSNGGKLDERKTKKISKK